MATTPKAANYRIRRKIGRHLADWLNAQVPCYELRAPLDMGALRLALRPGDVILVEGNTRVSRYIKTISQSTWSHVALYVGGPRGAEYKYHSDWLVEADIGKGVRAIPLTEYDKFNIRICRAVGLSPDECKKVCDFALNKIGHQYDLKNIIDLARYLFPWRAIPRGWCRNTLRLGSGDPTKAICSTLLAQAFQSVRYPILPQYQKQNHFELLLSRRHYTLFMPRDFDLSPYFEIVKPTIANGFDHRHLVWETIDD